MACKEKLLSPEEMRAHQAYVVLGSILANALAFPVILVMLYLTGMQIGTLVLIAIILLIIEASLYVALKKQFQKNGLITIPVLDYWKKHFAKSGKNTEKQSSNSRMN